MARVPAEKRKPVMTRDLRGKLLSVKEPEM